jgi:hypothetical protein
MTPEVRFAWWSVGLVGLGIFLILTAVIAGRERKGEQ